MSDPLERTPLNDEEFVRQMTASQRDLRAFIVGLVPHQVDADDLLQEVNLALWRKRDRFDSRQDYLRWAFGFAALQVRSFRSRSAKDKLWFDESTIEKLTAEWPHDSSFREDCSSALSSCLEKLGPRERNAIESRYRQHLSVKQIAKNMERPLSTVYKILHRALESLRNCVRQNQVQADHRV